MLIFEKYNPPYLQLEASCQQFDYFHTHHRFKYLFILILAAIPQVATGQHCDEAAWSYHMVMNTSDHHMLSTFCMIFPHLIFNVSRQSSVWNSGNVSQYVAVCYCAAAHVFKWKLFLLVPAWTSCQGPVHLELSSSTVWFNQQNELPAVTGFRVTLFLILIYGLNSHTI